MVWALTGAVCSVQCAVCSACSSVRAAGCITFCRKMQERQVGGVLGSQAAGFGFVWGAWGKQTELEGGPAATGGEIDLRTAPTRDRVLWLTINYQVRRRCSDCQDATSTLVKGFHATDTSDSAIPTERDQRAWGRQHRLFIITAHLLQTTVPFINTHVCKVRLLSAYQYLPTCLY